MARKVNNALTTLKSELTIQPFALKAGELDLLVKACQMKADGKGWVEIKRQIPVNHVKLDAAWYLYQAIVAGEVEREAFEKLTDEAKALRCATLRAEGLSWGRIRVRVGLTEGAVSTMASKATGIAREGTRNGRGGRFLKEIAEVGYKGNHRKFGTEAAPGTHRTVAEKNKEDDRSRYAASLARKTTAARKRVAKTAK